MSERSLGNVDDQRVGVVDTPGWSLFCLASPEQVRQEIVRSSVMSSYGSRVYLLTIPADSFKEKDRHALEKHVNLLGDGVWCRAILLFTWVDLLRGKNIEKHIEEMGEPLQWVLRKCAHRYHVINNICDSSQNRHLMHYIQTQMTVSPDSYIRPGHIPRPISPDSYIRPRPIPRPIQRSTLYLGNNFLDPDSYIRPRPIPRPVLRSTLYLGNNFLDNPRAPDAPDSIEMRNLGRWHNHQNMNMPSFYQH